MAHEEDALENSNRVTLWYSILESSSEDSESPYILDVPLTIECHLHRYTEGPASLMCLLAADAESSVLSMLKLSPTLESPVQFSDPVWWVEWTQSYKLCLDLHACLF